MSSATDLSRRAFLGSTVAASASVATGAHNGEVRVWNWEDGKQLASFIAVPQ